MAASSNPPPEPAWTTRVLFRTGGVGDFCWFSQPVEYVPRAADAVARMLRCQGLEVLVCTSDEFKEIGLPQTFAAEEYFSPA